MRRADRIHSMIDQRRDAMRTDLIAALARRNAMRTLRRRSLGVLSLILLTSVMLQVMARHPMTTDRFARQHADEGPSLKIDIRFVSTDVTTLDRFAPSHVDPVEIIDDAELLHALDAIGQPSGLVRTQRGVRLTGFDSAATLLDDDQDAESSGSL